MVADSTMVARRPSVLAKQKHSLRDLHKNPDEQNPRSVTPDSERKVGDTSSSPQKPGPPPRHPSLNKSGSGKRSTGTSPALLGATAKILANEDNEALKTMALVKRSSKSSLVKPRSPTPIDPKDPENMFERRPSLRRGLSKQAPGQSGRRHSTIAKDSPVVALSQPTDTKPEAKLNAGSSPTQTGSSIDNVQNSPVGSPMSSPGSTHSSLMSNPAPANSGTQRQTSAGIQLHNPSGQNSSAVVVQSSTGPCCSIG